MKTLAGIASGYASKLINRSADVIIKENRKLVIVPRETPFSAIHLENMLKLARMVYGFTQFLPFIKNLRLLMTYIIM